MPLLPPLTKAALRSQPGSAGSDSRRCVILADKAVVEQQPQSVVVEVAVAAGNPLGVLDFQVEVLGRAVGHGGVVEVRDQLISPDVQGAS